VSQEKKNRHVCQKCGNITYINPKTVAGFIPVTPQGQVVLLRREIEPAKGKWTYPAGYQEIGESIEDAAVRETKEEICVRVKIKNLVGIYSYPDAGVVTIVYAGSIDPRDTPRPGQESQDVKLFYPKDIPWKDLAFRSSVHALQDWLKTQRKKSRRA
jgi:ADP-ribose pyrophosphatase YjhB (NUDIX family)